MFKGLPPLIVVEHAGTAAPITTSMHEPVDGRVGLLVGDGGSEGRLAPMLLRALGKRRDPATSPRGLWNKPMAAAWLEANNIRDLFVGPAENLSRLDLVELFEAAAGCRVWLIFRETCRDIDHVKGYWPDFGATRHELLVDELANESRSVDERNSLPPLPLADPVRFRGLCRREFDALTFAKIDREFKTGFDCAIAKLSEDPKAPPEELAACGLDPSVPTWTSLARLRGAQVGALAFGNALEFDVGAWLLERGGAGEISKATLRAMHSAIDARASALTVTFCVSGASAKAVTRILVHDVATDGSSLYVQDRSLSVPKALRPFLAAYKAQRVVDGEGEPLFVSKSGKPVVRGQMRRDISAAIGRFGLPTHVQDDSWPATATSKLGLGIERISLRLTRLERL